MRRKKMDKRRTFHIESFWFLSLLVIFFVLYLKEYKLDLYIYYFCFMNWNAKFYRSFSNLDDLYVFLQSRRLKILGMVIKLSYQLHLPILLINRVTLFLKHLKRIIRYVFSDSPDPYVFWRSINSYPYDVFVCSPQACRTTSDATKCSEQSLCWKLSAIVCIFLQ